MSETKITDLVPQETIDKIKELNTEIQTLLNTYTTTAKELAKGVDVNVKVVGDIDKLEKLLVDKTKEATVATERLNAAISEQSQVVANTTNTISRQLMEQERVNKTQRDVYSEYDRVKKLLEEYNGTYDDHVKRLVSLNSQLAKNSKEQKDNEKALKQNRMSMAEFQAAQAKLIEQHRFLTQEKRTLTQIMTAEEKAMQTADSSYVQLSQQLELLKKAYKDLGAESRDSPVGKEMEEAIQNLDAHLKDVAADMGEFQRNVGNYAIAGQQGVVATESVIAAMNQEARTTQDLIDQTKILEEAKLMLNKEDANYQSTLDSLNAKIEENKRKLSDVSDIINKDATSVAEAESQNKRLQEALKHVDLTSDGAQQRIKELNDKIAANTKLIRDNTPAIQDQTRAMEQQKKANEGLAGNLLNMIGLNNQFGSSLKGLEGAGTANVFDGLNTKVKAFGKTLVGLLANPWVLAFLGIAGVVAGFKWWYDYNKGMIEASRLTQNFTGLTGDAADKITTDTQAIADHMGKGFDDTIGAANTLVQQFGISWEEALTKIEDGIEAGADMNGRFVENINQFAPALRDAGVSVDEFVSILAETRNGIFDEKGVQDIIKGGTRLRAMTKQIAESLDACGISSKQMQEDLANGNITMLEAVQQVSAKLKELPENSQEAGQVMKNVFGRTAAEGGTLLIQSLADVNTNLDEAKERMGDLGRLNREQMEAQKELNETLAAVFKMSGTSFEEMTIQAKTYIVQGLTNIIKGCVDIVNWFIRMYNNSLYVRGAVNSIVNSFKTLWEVAKFILNQVMDSFKALGNMIEDVVTLNWDQVAGHWAEGMKALKGNVETMVRNIASNTADAFNNTLKDELKPVSIELDANLTGLGANPGNDKPKTPYSPTAKEPTDKEKAKAAKEAEKAAKEELKRIHELEESKIAVMAEGHEKELAMIRLKFKKKIDEIKGDGETENALRVQLAEQCQKEIADCELKYQTELAKINLENRLASVEEGSKEELDLKLAQLEATRAAELKAAERTGADVTLINDKFNKERLELEEEYANNLADKITERYGVEEITRNQEYSNAVNALKERYAKEMALAAGNAAKQEEIKRNLENDLYALEVEYSQKAGEAAIKMIEEILNLENLSAEDRLKWEQELAKAKIDLANQIADANSESVDRQIADDERLREKRKANFQNWLQVASDAIGNISELVNTLFDGQIEKLEEEQEANTEAGEKEQERITELVNKKVITQEEGEARKRAAEAQTAKKNEELEKKKQQLKHKQAVWEKANSLAQAGIATALAITHALPNLVLAAIAGAMGAIQIATILATPIPKYAKGTDYHRGGPAIVGDGGRSEVVLFNGGAWLTPDKPTLVNMPEGAIVIPSVTDYDDNPAGLLMMPVGSDKTPTSRVYDDSAIRRGVSELIYLIKCQTRQQHCDSYLTNYEFFKSKI